MSTIKEWKVLRLIKPEFVVNIRSVFVFDTKAIFMITNNNHTYGLGLNTNGCVGLGHTKEIIEPTIINELCGETVIDFKFGHEYSNILALTENGCVYSWGGNTYGQLANGNTTACYSPKLIEALNGLKISEIRCGGYFCMALTVSGDIYSWGKNSFGELGVDTNSTQETKPMQVTTLDKFKIVAIECGYNHSLALTDNGIVFGWGLNNCGQLGIGNTTNARIPIKLDLQNDIMIAKIKCGFNHCLLVALNGDIYSFGHNSCGQIGDASAQQKTVPVKISVPFKCTDIAVTHCTNISIAKLENGFCYVWGECDGQTFLSPYDTHYENINDVIINFSRFKWNHDNISGGLNSIISKRFIASFDSKKYSDIAFKIDNQLIYAQKKYLISVCKHFETMFSDNNWTENDGEVITITQYRYQVYHAFLRYLYTGLVDIRTEHAFDLLDLANSYFEDELKRKCAQIIKFEINCENVCAYYSSAVKYELIELRECCLSFAQKNIRLVKETDGFRQSEDISLLKELIHGLVNYCN